MSLRDVMEFIQKQHGTGAADTPDTPLKPVGYHGKPNAHAGCTPDTPDTPALCNVGQVAQEKPPSEAANDPGNSTPAPDQHGANTGPAPEPPDWRLLDAAYLAHHAHCPVCIAAGRSARYGLRCGAGASLWRDYSAAVNTPGALPWQQPKGKK